MKLIDLTGKQFERLTVLHRGLNKQKQPAWVCRCVCGTEKTIAGNDLKKGHARSCGCLASEIKRKRLTVHGESSTRKSTSSALHRCWTAMKNRCYNPKNRAYKNYGQRGIAVCNEWVNSYVSFRDWALTNGWEKGLTIDRRNNDGNYNPENCRWVTSFVQSHNRRNTPEHKRL